MAALLEHVDDLLSEVAALGERHRELLERGLLRVERRVDLGAEARYAGLDADRIPRRVVGEDAAERRHRLAQARLERGRAVGGHAEHEAAGAEEIDRTRVGGERTQLCSTRSVRDEEHEVGRAQLRILHDEVVVERGQDRFAERCRDRERQRGLGFVGARHHEEIGLDATLLLDEQPVGALPSLALGELAGDEAVEPARAVLARHQDRRAIGGGHDEHALA